MKINIRQSMGHSWVTSCVPAWQRFMGYVLFSVPDDGMFNEPAV